MRPRLIVPPGWRLLPVSGDNRAVAIETFKSAWERGPRDSIGPHIHRMEEWLESVLNEAAEADAYAVAMPMGIPWQVPVSTAIALSVRDPGSSHAPVLPSIGEGVETDAGPARRRITDVDVPTDADPEELALLRTIDYTWVTPDQRSYLIAFASISGLPVAEYAPVTEALTTLITTMLDAIDWPTAPAATPTAGGDAEQ